MFNRIRKTTAILLLVTFIFMLVPAQADTTDTTNLFGIISGDKYENTFAGIGCLLEGWHYYTDEEIEQTNQKSKEIISEEIRELVNENVTVMAAESADKLQNVNIQIRNAQEYVAVYEAYGLGTIAENSIDQFRSTLESTGMTDVQLSVSTMNISGEDIPCIGGQYKYKGITMYFRQLWLLRGDYLVYVTVTTLTSDKTEETFSSFYLIP